jgi:hypothetical protein
MKKWMLGALLLIILVFAAASVTLAQDATAEATQEMAPVIQVPFYPEGSSKVTGFVLLQSQASGGTFINVIVFGLQPDGKYVSLYYDNNTCDLASEPDAAKDPIGNVYVGNKVGVGVTEGEIDDSLDKVGSVSVRTGPNDQTLLACADIKTGATAPGATQQPGYNANG